MKAQALGRVEKGKFIADDPRAFKAAFYGHEGKRVRLTVDRFRKKRSDPQNAYYWAVVVPMIGEAIGESDLEDVHEALKARFNSEIVVIAEEEIKVPRSTAKLDTAQFAEYVEKVRRWASEFLSLYIPDPAESAFVEAR